MQFYVLKPCWPCWYGMCRGALVRFNSVSAALQVDTSYYRLKAEPVAYHASLPEYISAWECRRYASPESSNVAGELNLTTTRRMPFLSHPNHVLIKVKAASLNPIDLLMIKGYGAQSFRCLRRSLSLGFTDGGASEFPLTPGRDFSGEVVGLGPAVSRTHYRSCRDSLNTFTIGQKVCGATWPYLSSTGSGALAEYIICPAEFLAPIPLQLNYAQSAAIGYAGLTAWSALTRAGGMTPHFRIQTDDSPRVLVCGASGGVGLIAAQLARHWGAKVHVTCPGDTKALQLMKHLQFEEVIVYPDVPPATTSYDIIIDCIRPEYLTNSTSTNKSNKQQIIPLNPFNVLPHNISYLKPGANSRYVCLNPPLLYYLDAWGPLFGVGAAVGHAFGSQLVVWANAVSQVAGSWPPGQLRWAFFKADGKRLSRLLTWLASGRLEIPIDTTVSFNEVPSAFTRLQSRGVRGKVLVTL